MASQRLSRIDILFRCPICYDKFRDPRILACTHQFCLKCLDQLFVNSSPGQSQLTCPACRTVTPVLPGKKVSDLPRPVLMNEVQELMLTLRKQSEEKPTKVCNFCKSEDGEVSTYCYQCNKIMCESCQTDHDESDFCKGHKTVAICDDLFCKVHDDVVTAYCQQCQCLVCLECLFKDHKKHLTGTIEKVATQSRLTIKELMKAQSISTMKASALAEVSDDIQNERKNHNSLDADLNSILITLKHLQSQVLHIRESLHKTKESNIKKLESCQAELQHLDISSANFLELGHYLMEKASDHELASKAKEISTLADFRAQVQQPDIDQLDINMFGEMKKDVDALFESCRKSIFVKFPQDHLQIMTNIREIGDIKSVAFVSNSSQLAVLVGSGVTIYNTDGKEVKKLNLLGSTRRRDRPNDVDFDHARELFLSPYNGHMTITDLQGKVKDFLNLQAGELYGVTYNGGKDQYIVTDKREMCVIVIDAKSRKEIKTIELPPGNITPFLSLFVAAGDISGCSMIVISDSNSHTVKLFDLSSGKLIKAYGKDGPEDSQLCYPRGVTVDNHGAVIVCDSENRRVLKFWCSEGKEMCHCLLSEDELDGMPMAIDLNTTYDLLAVYVDQYQEDFFYGDDETAPGYYSYKTVQIYRYM